jgi:hypothetical protein
MYFLLLLLPSVNKQDDIDEGSKRYHDTHHAHETHPVARARRLRSCWQSFVCQCVDYGVSCRWCRAACRINTAVLHAHEEPGRLPEHAMVAPRSPYSPLSSDTLHPPSPLAGSLPSLLPLASPPIEVAPRHPYCICKKKSNSSVKSAVPRRMPQERREHLVAANPV